MFLSLINNTGELKHYFDIAAWDKSKAKMLKVA
jgi:hypothetical protein